MISVRNAIGGTAPGKLRDAVKKEFINISDQERNVREILAKLESGFIKRFMELHHE